MLRKGLVIYEPKGRAGEYAPLAINLYRGCGHGCVYCYAPYATFTEPKDFHRQAAPRPEILKRLRRDAPKAAATYTREDKRVLLCFTCDPYQPINDTHGLTRQAIEILHANGFKVNILTKGGHRAEEDFDLLGAGDQFATTLTFMDKDQSRIWEPFAAPPQDRIATLKQAHIRGIYTWVSLEPVIDPPETLEIIKQTHTFVDLFKVGTLNNHPQADKIDWPQFANAVIATLEQHQCQYYLKADLRRYLFREA